MATWQLDLHLIPEDAPMPTVEGDFDIPAMPAGLTRDAQEELAGVFGQPWLMLNDWLVYGAEKGTRIDFNFDAMDTVEIMVRLDVSSVGDTLLDAICTLARTLGCRYFDIEGRQLFEPRPEVVRQIIANSRASKFVRNPLGFIASLPIG